MILWKVLFAAGLGVFATSCDIAHDAADTAHNAEISACEHFIETGLEEPLGYQSVRSSFFDGDGPRGEKFRQVVVHYDILNGSSQPTEMTQLCYFDLKSGVSPEDAADISAEIRKGGDNKGCCTQGPYAR
jgi:hypothetical protein